ncbi:MAG: hypothetical protein AAGA20_01640 [Planctomycetota bacterium]
MSDESETPEGDAKGTTAEGPRGSRRGRADAGASGGQPPRRELEEAPRLLKNSSVVLIIGALFPWMTAIRTEGNMPWSMWIAGVVLTLVAGWLLYDGANARFGAKANGISKALANANPMAATGASLVFFIAAIVVAFMGKSYFMGETGEFLGFAVDPEAEGVRNRYSIPAALEHATLFLGLATFAHIHAYEYGARFNPIFPLMFLGPAIAGALAVLRGAAAIGDFPLAIVGVLGSLIVAAGGIMAMYTMYVTMKVAKEEGDRKKAEDRERRRAERSARRS